ncbi:unnamed protein product [Protopolystoma xenopodis]|uniref:Uncharacterized protein n=1 Tax=Protopolystoma xenopodis TaxID=117903 RepID=A0A3S5BCG5_9PLAT|nr:unnamed protein product [Protopolystoma xenopodis]
MEVYNLNWRAHSPCQLTGDSAAHPIADNKLAARGSEVSSRGLSTSTLLSPSNGACDWLLDRLVPGLLSPYAHCACPASSPVCPANLTLHGAGLNASLLAGTRPTVSNEDVLSAASSIVLGSRVGGGRSEEPIGSEGVDDVSLPIVSSGQSQCFLNGLAGRIAEMTTAPIVGDCNGSFVNLETEHGAVLSDSTKRALLSYQLMQVEAVHACKTGQFVGPDSQKATTEALDTAVSTAVSTGLLTDAATAEINRNLDLLTRKVTELAIEGWYHYFVSSSPS